MTLRTLGTNANNTLNALLWANGGAGLLAADMATFRANIKNDLINGTPIYPFGLDNNGLLYVPNRGYLKVLPGDFIGYDASGWPILISAYSIANSANWTHT